MAEIITKGINSYVVEKGLRDTFETQLQKAILGQDTEYNAEGALNLMTDLLKKLPITGTFVKRDNTVRTISEIIADFEVNEASGALFLEYAAQHSSVSCSVTCQ